MSDAGLYAHSMHTRAECAGPGIQFPGPTKPIHTPAQGMPGRLFLSIRKTTSFLSLQEVRALIILAELDRKSTRLNSSHLVISYAVFCLKKKKKKKNNICYYDYMKHILHKTSVRFTQAQCRY